MTNHLFDLDGRINFADRETTIRKELTSNRDQLRLLITDADQPLLSRFYVVIYKAAGENEIFEVSKPTLEYLRWHGVSFGFA